MAKTIQRGIMSVRADAGAPSGAEVKALILDELRRLHEGVLARYGLRPSEWRAWESGQQR